MKRFIIAAVVVSLVATSAVAMSSSKASARAPDPFIGAWEAVDVPDLSNLTVAISGGPMGLHRFTLFDDSAIGCPGGVPAIFRGTATVSDTTMLDVDGVVRCLSVGVLIPASFTLTYDSGTDTLIAADGTTFNRVGP